MENDVPRQDTDERADGFRLPSFGETIPVLERLGASPFPRSGFPLMGFLATLYDHVAAFARERQ